MLSIRLQSEAEKSLRATLDHENGIRVRAERDMYVQRSRDLEGQLLEEKTKFDAGMSSLRTYTLSSDDGGWSVTPEHNVLLGPPLPYTPTRSRPTAAGDSEHDSLQDVSSSSSHSLHSTPTNRQRHTASLLVGADQPQDFKAGKGNKGIFLS